MNREVERWRRLFVLGEIDELRYRHKAGPLRRRLEKLEALGVELDVERAMGKLLEVGILWRDSGPKLQREYVSEVFERITVKGAQITEIAPKPSYAPLFVIDRQERFGGNFECVDWLPGQDSNLRHGG